MEKLKKKNKRRRKIFCINFGCFHNTWESNRWEANTALCPQRTLCRFALKGFWAVPALFKGFLWSVCLSCPPLGVHGRGSRAGSIPGTLSAATAWAGSTCVPWAPLCSTAAAALQSHHWGENSLGKSMPLNYNFMYCIYKSLPAQEYFCID